VGHFRAQKIQLAKRRQVAQRFESAVGNAGAIKVQFLELRQVADRLQTLIGHERIMEVQAGQVLHALKVLHSFIAKGGIAQVECPQVDKRGQACALDVGLGQSQLAQLCETSEVRETLILNVDVGQKMQAEMQLLEILETSKGAQLVVGIEATARARIPDRPGKIKFLESGQAADPLEILGNNNGSSQVDADDAN